jgi:hypothetical protein
VFFEGKEGMELRQKKIIVNFSNYTSVIISQDPKP